MGQGVDNSPVPCYWEHDEPKSMGHSHTFPIDISDPIMIKAYTLMLCQKLAERLRNEGKNGVGAKHFQRSQGLQPIYITEDRKF
jgi:nucleotidyltransferase/DNA polymerase involved in DNA repair